MQVNKNWIIAITIVIVGVVVLAGGIYLQKKRATGNNNTGTKITDVVSTTTVVTEVPLSEATSTLQAGEDMSLKAVKYTELPKDLLSQNFQWQKPEKIKNMGMFVNNYIENGCDGPGCIVYSDKKQEYYQIANFKYNNQDGKIVVTSIGQYYSVDFYEYFFVVWNNQTILLQKLSQKIVDGDGLNKNNFLVDKTLPLPAITYEKEINIPGKQKLTFKAVGKISAFVDNGNGNGKSYPEGKKILVITYNNEKLQDYGNYFVMFKNDVWPIEYTITMPKQLLFDDGKTAKVSDYLYTMKGTCGIGNYVDVMDYDQSDLTLIGKADDGNLLYALKNTTTNDSETKLMWTNYDGQVTYSGKTPISYDNFLQLNPIVIMQDTFGRYIRFRLEKYYLDMAECGKPVIYLYPTKDTNINVKVQPNGGFSKTEPTYLDNGWNVRATPQSEIFNYADNTSYPYLFWEGKAYDMTFPNAGFVMKKENVGTQMHAILSKLGLVEKEINDFMEFWQPKLEVKPYVYVTFLPQKDFDRLAPLIVTPKPDKTIRVFMDYQPLENSITVQPLHITTPTRTGFTVVEWGGRLHK